MAIIRPTKDDARRISSAVRRVEAMPANEPPRPRNASSNLIETHWVHITDTTQTEGRYPGTLFFRDQSGASAAFTQIGDAGGIWVDSPNGEALSENIKYGARSTGVKTSDGKPVFDVLGRFGLTAITVEESDGTPSYTDVTVLEFDQASKFKVTQPAAGRAKVEIEGLTSTETIVTAVSCTAGTLSVTTKQFAFTDGILQSVT